MLTLAPLLASHVVSGHPLLLQLALPRLSLPLASAPPRVPLAAACLAPASTLHPRWVNTLNVALEASAMSTLLAYMLVDVAATFSVLGALTILRVAVPADFALALALSKALRGPRLALDASLAAWLTRRFPALRAVKVSLCFDEFAASLHSVGSSFDEGRQAAGGAPPHANAPPRASAPPRAKLATAAQAARQMTSQYGLAYMAAKNAVALASMLITLAALRTARSATAALIARLGVSSAAGELAGRAALAVTIHYALFPAVCLTAAALGPRLHNATQRRLGERRL
jgi:hypothetical protein